MIRRGRKNSYRVLRRILMVAALIYAAYYAYGRWFGFNPEQILENSLLKTQNFEAEVQEVVSPRYKIKAYLLRDKTNPIVAMSFIFKGAGWSTEAAEQAGISALVEQLLLSGAGKYDEEQFADILEDKAISIGFSSAKDDFSGAVMATKENSTAAFDLLKTVLKNPRFEASEMSRAKLQLLEALKQQQEQPGKILSLAFAKEMYANHPYGRNPLGSAKTVKKLVRADLIDFMQQRFTRENLIVGVAGDISANELSHLLDDVFGSLPQSMKIGEVPLVKAEFVARSKDIQLTTAQNIAMFAVLGAARNEPDFYPLYVANFIFGGSGLNSRLSQAIRENEGLTYSVGTGLGLDDKLPLLVGSYSATPDNFARVGQILHREWKNFAKNGATSAEVKAAKDYLIASYNLRFASIADIAAILAYMQRDNLGRDFLEKRNEYVDAVTLKQVNDAAAKYFDESKLIQVNIGNFVKNSTEQEAQ